MSNETNFYCDKTLDDLKQYEVTVFALDIFEGTCIVCGSIFMLLTVLQLIVFDRLKKFYTIIQSQVCTVVMYSGCNPYKNIFVFQKIVIVTAEVGTVSNERSRSFISNRGIHEF